jgi:hypothetical protein
MGGFMNFQEFLDKHKYIKKSIRTYIMIFVKSGEETYLDSAVKSLSQLTEMHKKFEENTGCCPRTALLENHKTEMEHRAKVLEIEKALEKASKAKLENTETETILAKQHGKVTWKKGA